MKKDVELFIKELENLTEPDPTGRTSDVTALSLLNTADVLVKSNGLKQVETKYLFKFLKYTSNNEYLKQLPDTEQRFRWAEVVFQMIQISGYTLKDMFDQRVEKLGFRILFQDMGSSIPIHFTYKQINRHIREIAALFHTITPGNPRVAIFCENSIESACCDLACLFYDIFDTPLNPHFSQKILTAIFDQLNINIVVTDTKERLDLFRRMRKDTKSTYTIFATDPILPLEDEKLFFLGEECKRMNDPEIATVLDQRKKKKINQVATTMFTSGSTGEPKGVSFSIYHLVSKRFARAASLPDVGRNEMLLCFLPLYHTFGRYLEMLGSIFWGGTYVFTGNPSAETLLALFPIVNPTGFISIPLRWAQLHEKVIDHIGNEEDPKKIQKLLREVVGKKLKWGLSAAGFLDPKTFRFFENHGINLCSGFGMTEATGGITMTPPGEYMENTTGIPLPGISVRFSKEKELEISGHYIGNYLEKAGPEDLIPFPGKGKDEYFLSTGDIFRINKDGYYEIIDRVKDIYKNNKGQTIAPRMIERFFIGVPGIKNSFLVGDGKPYNVLLIVPDTEDPVLKSSPSIENQDEYFQQIVTAANKELAPYERIVNFAILSADFDASKGELTPKGSFNRKTIEKNFHDVIKKLYISNYIHIEKDGIQIVIPRWIIRDLGILDHDIKTNDKGLYNKRSKESLSVSRTNNDNEYLIGDLLYTIKGNRIDLGLFTRQPRLWIGNPALIKFSSCKEGWDLPLEAVSAEVFLPKQPEKEYTTSEIPPLKSVHNQKLLFINNLICTALFSDNPNSLKATRQIGKAFKGYDEKVAVVIRRRLEALSRHRDEDVRALAYRILLLDDPHLDYSKLFPAFIQSGLTFLNEKSINEIAVRDIGKQHLIALRQRLFTYRTQLAWPASKVTQKQFKHILELLFNFARQHLEYYGTVRAELASWILHKSDPFLSKIAQEYFVSLTLIFDKREQESSRALTEKEWTGKLFFDAGFPENEIEGLKHLFSDSTFLKESITLAYEDVNFDLHDIPENGIWISKLLSLQSFPHYRLTINTMSGKLFDLHFMRHDKLNENHGLETIFWFASLSGHPYGSLSLPALGCSRPDIGVLSTKYISELTVWEKIREFAGIHHSLGYLDKPNSWRKLFIKAFTVFYKVWGLSNSNIVPGPVSPGNVVVPELDYLETATILSISGWEKYQDPLSLVKPFLKNFYQNTVAHYPWCKHHLKVSWIFDASIEALGKEKADEFINELKACLKKEPIHYFDHQNLLDDIVDFQERKYDRNYLPLSLYNAIDQYNDWKRYNPTATPSAKEETIFELSSLYRIYQFPEIVRYYFYRHTYFADMDEKLVNAFDHLLNKMYDIDQVPAFRLIELSDLQDRIIEEEDRYVFSRMVFSRLRRHQKIDLLRIGEEKKQSIVVQSELEDKKGIRYTMREPLDPGEIGQLYRLFYEENYPKSISEMDKHFVVTDSLNRVVAGLCYIILENDGVLLDGSAVTTALKGRGIGSAMIENFCGQMAGLGAKVIKAHFLMGNFYLKLNFKVDKKWGALVRFL